MSMAPVAAATSGNSSGATKSNTQSIAWPRPAMKPSSDIDLFTTTLPFPVLVFRTVLLQRIFAGCHPGLRVMTLRAPESHRLASDKGPPQGDDRQARLDAVRLFLDPDFAGGRSPSRPPVTASRATSVPCAALPGVGPGRAWTRSSADLEVEGRKAVDLVPRPPRRASYRRDSTPAASQRTEALTGSSRSGGCPPGRIRARTRPS